MVMYELDVEVHSELQWVRAQPKRVDFAFALVVNPAFDHPAREDIALG